MLTGKSILTRFRTKITSFVVVFTRSRGSDCLVIAWVPGIGSLIGLQCFVKTWNCYFFNRILSIKSKFFLYIINPCLRTSLFYRSRRSDFILHLKDILVMPKIRVLFITFILNFNATWFDQWNSFIRFTVNPLLISVLCI